MKRWDVWFEPESLAVEKVVMLREDNSLFPRSYIYEEPNANGTLSFICSSLDELGAFNQFTQWKETEDGQRQLAASRYRNPA